MGRAGHLIKLIPDRSRLCGLNDTRRGQVQGHGLLRPVLPKFGQVVWGETRTFRAVYPLESRPVHRFSEHRKRLDQDFLSLNALQVSAVVSTPLRTSSGL